MDKQLEVIKGFLAAIGSLKKDNLDKGLEELIVCAQLNYKRLIEQYNQEDHNEGMIHNEVKFLPEDTGLAVALSFEHLLKTLHTKIDNIKPVVIQGGDNAVINTTIVSGVTGNVSVSSEQGGSSATKYIEKHSIYGKDVKDVYLDYVKQQAEEKADALSKHDFYAAMRKLGYESKRQNNKELNGYTWRKK